MRILIWIIAVGAVVAIIIGLISFGSKLDIGIGNGTDNPDTTGNNKEMIRVTAPEKNDTVTSPLTITGEARGNWYFEASFPVRLIDANGRVLAEHYAQAQGEWMTTEFVPFTSTITFTNPTTTTGTLILMKDNPSGLPENDAEVRLPIKFNPATTSSQMQTIKLFYYNESKDKDASGNVICSAKGLESVERQIPRTQTPIQDSVKLLIRGELTATERSKGLSTDFPIPSLQLNSASLTSGVLTLSFASGANTGGGSCRAIVLRAQVESTAKQFGSVNTVKFLPVGLFEP